MYDKGPKLRDRKPTNPGLIRTSPYGDWKEQGGGGRWGGWGFKEITSAQTTFVNAKRSKP